MFLFGETCLAQDYPIPAEGAEWFDTEIEFLTILNSRSTQRYEATGDTIIDSSTYTKIIRTEEIGYYFIGPCDFNIVHHKTNNYIGAIRTNIDQQVLFVPAGDTISNLIYDFSVDVGDSIVIDVIDSQCTFLVTSIDSIVITNDSRKLISLMGMDCLKEQWIEGIGSTFGFFATWFQRYWEFYDYALTCYFENNIQIYPERVTGCNLCDILTNTNGIQTRHSITINPNPLLKESRILYPNEIQPIRINVYTIEGRLVYSKDIIDNQNISINRDMFDSGILILELIDSKYYSFKKKFIAL
jgi:hypothetical protein